MTVQTATRPMPPSAPPAPGKTAPLAVMIVDDAVVVRGLIGRWLSERPTFEVVASAANGRVALDALDRVTPDIILLDIDMPEMDGLEALPLLLRKCPTAAVVISSTLTRRNAELSLKCLSLGATECISKPETNREVTTSQSFRQELVTKLEALGEGRRRLQALRDGAPAPAPAGAASTAGILARVRGEDAAPPAGQPARAPVAPAIVPRLACPPRALVIGSSTGGPRAVAEVLASAGESLRNLPVIVVQHMPPIFTAVFAEHLRLQTGYPAREPFDGEQFQPGVVYVAPGGRHLRIARTDGGAVVARVVDAPPVNFCRPAVDLMFKDAAEVFGAAALGLVLTGMGHDGLDGARALSAAGATIVVQDEATSAVWGMPGSIARAGLARAILPLPAIGPSLGAAIGGAR